MCMHTSIEISVFTHLQPQISTLAIPQLLKHDAVWFRRGLVAAVFSGFLQVDVFFHQSLLRIFLSTAVCSIDWSFFRTNSIGFISILSDTLAFAFFLFFAHTHGGACHWWPAGCHLTVASRELKTVGIQFYEIEEIEKPVKFLLILFGRKLDAFELLVDVGFIWVHFKWGCILHVLQLCPI